MAHARSLPDNGGAIRAFWFGIATVVLFLIALASQNGIVSFCLLVCSITSVVVARFARQHGQRLNDQQLVYLTRYGQLLGWIVLALFIIVYALIAIVLGSFAASL